MPRGANTLLRNLGMVGKGPGGYEFIEAMIIMKQEFQLFLYLLIQFK